MLPSFARTSVTVTRAPYKDSRGTKVRDWTHSVSKTLDGCSFQPVSSDTSWTDVSQAVTVRARLWCPPDSDIQAGDRVTVSGTQYAVNGAPAPWESPTGAVDHIVCDLVDWRL